ncbi:hypothetical protein PIB30_071665 [Stylosanthes scabra]|uniref:Uncharacterized protein n=1 Tax=Stylosanthes scabra TaxID=79078 RepID=A0ABU6SNZ2_9FABA|nr:hypothetical protein [Stylosanthes scabra]
MSVIITNKLFGHRFSTTAWSSVQLDSDDLAIGRPEEHSRIHCEGWDQGRWDSSGYPKEACRFPPTPRNKVDLLNEKVNTLEKEKQDFEKKWLSAKSEVSKLKKSVNDLEHVRKKSDKELAGIKSKNEELDKEAKRLKFEYELLEDDSFKSNEDIVENLHSSAQDINSKPQGFSSSFKQHGGG